MKGNQEWKYNHQVRIILVDVFYFFFLFQIRQLLHVVSGKCLEMSRDGAKLTMKACDTNNDYQNWTFQEYDADRAKQYGLA